MIRLTQKRTGRNGTCFPTALASILETTIPDFGPTGETDEREYWGRVDRWLASKGFRYVQVPVGAVRPIGYSTVEGISPRGGMHACVAWNGEIVWDPHPQDGTPHGLARPLTWGLLLPLNGGVQTKTSNVAEDANTVEGPECKCGENRYQAGRCINCGRQKSRECPCGETRRKGDWNDKGERIWKCINCGRETPRFTSRMKDAISNYVESLWNSSGAHYQKFRSFVEGQARLLGAGAVKQITDRAFDVLRGLDARYDDVKAAVVDVLNSQSTNDADFKEADHPRASNGQFGKGGGAEEPVTVSQPKRAPFVQSFLDEHRSIAAQERYMKTVPDDKLRKGIELIKRSGELSAGSQHVQKLMENELRSRARDSVRPVPPFNPGDPIRLKNGRRTTVVKCVAAEDLFGNEEWHVSTASGDIVIVKQGSGK